MNKFICSQLFFYIFTIICTLAFWAILFMYGGFAAFIYFGVFLLLVWLVSYSNWKMSEYEKDNKVYPIDKLKQQENEEDEDHLVFI